MALNTTPAAANADSYASLAELDAYLADNPYASGWNNAADSRKEWTARATTRLLDAMRGAWTGVASTAEQALGWPRTGMLNRNGYPIASGEVPIQLKNAQAEYCLRLVATDLTATNDIAAQGITSVKAGPVAVTFKDPLSSHDAAIDANRALDFMVPDAVRAMLVPSWLIDPREDDAEFTGIVFESLES